MGLALCLSALKFDIAIGIAVPNDARQRTAR